MQLLKYASSCTLDHALPLDGDEPLPSIMYLDKQLGLLLFCPEYVLLVHYRFAELAACIFLNKGFKIYLFSQNVPTPYVVRSAVCQCLIACFYLWALYMVGKYLIFNVISVSKVTSLSFFNACMSYITCLSGGQVH